MSVWGRSWSGVKRSPWRLTPHWPEGQLDARCSGNRAGGHREVDRRPGVPGPRPRGRCDHGLHECGADRGVRASLRTGRADAAPTAPGPFGAPGRCGRPAGGSGHLAPGPRPLRRVWPGDAGHGRLAGLERSRLLSALSGVVESLTSDSSLVIVVEDLHRVDTSTLALLGVLLRGTPQTGLLVVVTAREPAPSEQVRRWCAVERASARLSVLAVPPFTASETSQLLAAEGQDRRRRAARQRSTGCPGGTRSWCGSSPGWTRCHA